MQITTADEVGRNLSRVSVNLQQSAVTRVLSAVAQGGEVSDEDIRYVHSVLEDATDRYAAAVADLDARG